MSIFFFVYRYSGNLSVVGGILIVDFIIVGKKVIFWFRVKLLILLNSGKEFLRNNYMY